MAAHFPRMEPAHLAFISRQKIFFNASAADSGRVNVSPRDVASLRVLNDHTVAYLDLTGSGNETSAHVRSTGRLTLMFCALEGPPLILRLYGKGRILRRGSAEYTALLAEHFDDEERAGARQIVVLDINAVQTSCGYNVPQFDYVKERDTLIRWAEKKGDEGLEQYRREKNVRSIDGFPTGWPEE
ncbi:MAG: pyridoxamine 5'-phosphate oxidase family protein [Acidobacteriota bacterium]